ncbi:MAG: multicopper oxidase domain-containing protein [Nitrospirae bacterium]|nr:multicopper oxidase domain-containing protein [Nitrospirota bacterium]
MKTELGINRKKGMETMAKRSGLRRSMMFCGLLLLSLVLLNSGKGWAAAYNLKATTGTATMPDGAVIPIWGYAACTDETFTSCGPATLPGPQLEVTDGSLTINLSNDLPEPVSIMIPGQTIQPTPTGKSFTVEAASGGGTASYTFSNVRPGTHLYESGSNHAKQVQMGLYGALIVRPAGFSSSNLIDFDSNSTFNQERVLLLSEIDPDWHAAVSGGQQYNGIYFNPKYWLMNGKAYPETQDLITKSGNKMLLRYLNAGAQDHVIVIQGISQHEVANDGYPVNYPQDTYTALVNPGETRDLMITPSAMGTFSLFDRRLDITNKDKFPGGMISMLRVIDSTLTGLQILSTAPGMVTVENLYSYDTVAIDADHLDATLIYTIVPGPSTVSSLTPATVSVDPSTGRITWPTILADNSATNGSYPMTLSVSDSYGGPVSQTFNVYVNSNPAFGGALGSVSIAAGSTYSGNASATDADASDVVSYALSSTMGMSGLSINPSTGALTWNTSTSSAGLYNFNIVATDGKGGIASQVVAATITSSSPPAVVQSGICDNRTDCQNVTLSAVEFGNTATSLTTFQFVINVDNTSKVDPDTGACDPCPSTHLWESNSPVAAVGMVTAATFGVSNVVQLPPGNYFVTIHAGEGDPSSPYFRQQVRNGGTYKLDGTRFNVSGSPVPVQLQLHKNPLPLGQITVQVFWDNRALNAEWDVATEGVPFRTLDNLGNPIPDHFKVLVHDSLGQVTTDAYANPLCTEYTKDANGQYIYDPATGAPIAINSDPNNGGAKGGAVCMTDDNGFLRIPNIAPGLYGVVAFPPEDSDWVQTTTIEGTKSIDAWVREADNGILPEGLSAQSYAILQGFVRPCKFSTVIPSGADPCPTSHNPGTGIIHGQVKAVAPSRPPYLYADGLGKPVVHPWVALSNTGGNLEQVALIQGDDQGNFSIDHVPAGAYNVVIWDDPKDFILAIFAVTIADGQNLELFDPLISTDGNRGIGLFDWWGRFVGNVFYDANENGIKDEGEKGLVGEYVELRKRDGSLIQSTTTDANGYYNFREHFPWYGWDIAGIGYSRFGDTGLTYWAGLEQAKMGQPITEGPVTIKGPQLVMGVLPIAGETNQIDWGKKPYPLNDPDTITPFTGGISWVVWYASTRNENDIAYAAADNWETGIPDLWLNLYERLVDPKTGKTVMDPVTGAAVKGRLLGRAITDHFNRPEQIPTHCPIIDFTTGTPGFDENCTETYITWAQVKPGVYDGAYQFFFDQSNPADRANLLNCDDVGVDVTGLDPNKCRPLRAGTYLVELEVPNNYSPLTENDRNVIDQGDVFKPTPLRAPPSCVGPLYSVIYPDDTNSNYVNGTKANLCTLKEVTVDPNANAANDFHLFTDVQIPGHMVGFVNDNNNFAAKTTSPWFGDKEGIPFLPISIRDWAGKEIDRVYTDQNGMFDLLVPSTARPNAPKPTGYSENVVLVTANDPGTAQNPEPHFNPNYDSLLVQFEVMPGRPVFPDMALTPVNGLLAQMKVDCGPDATTPQVSYVDDPIKPRGQTLTVTGTGFGSTAGRLLIDSTVITATSWSPTVITWTIPSTFATGAHQLTVQGSNLKVSPAGITVHITGTGYNPHIVDVSPGGTSLHPIQDAIDAAGTVSGSVIRIHPGTYRENPIVYKNISLQGYGTAGVNATIIDGGYLTMGTSLALQNDWTNKMTAVIASTDVTVVDQQPISETMSTITVFGRDGSTRRIRIDGLKIQGARGGSGVHVNAYASNTIVSNNLIQNNMGSLLTSGGGVSLGFPNFGSNVISNPRIHHNKIISNGGTQDGSGVAVYDGVGPYQVDHNLICDNGSMVNGGGIAHFGTNPSTSAGSIDHNDILFNWDNLAGAGIALEGPPNANVTLPSVGTGPVLIDTNRIYGNFATQDGGGISVRYVNNSSIRIQNNMITNNMTSDAAGALSVRDAANLVVINNTIANNNATASTNILIPGKQAGGITIYPNTLPFQNNVIRANSPTVSDIHLYNNIMWGNDAYQWNVAGRVLADVGPIDLDVYGVPGATLTHVEDNLFTASAVTATISNTSNQFGANPAFVSSVANAVTGQYVPAQGDVISQVIVHYLPLTVSGDYHVQTTSPALEYGGRTFEAGRISAPTTDFDGQARPIDNCIDSGADETQAVTVCVVHPDLVVSALSAVIGIVQPGGTLLVTNSVTNQGNGSAGASTLAFHLSKNSIYGDVDDVTSPTTRAIAALLAGASNNALATAVTIPANTPLGTYYLCAMADSTLAVAESDEGNNSFCTTSTIEVVQADLIVSTMGTLSKTSISRAGSSTVRTFTVQNAVQNAGNLLAGPNVLGFVLSTNPNYTGTGSSVALSGTRTIFLLGAGASSPGTGTTTSPNLTVGTTTPTGTYYVCGKADINNNVSESNEGNNWKCTASTLTITP